MLNRYENEVMAAVYSRCDGTEGCLVSPLDILSILPSKHKYTAERLEERKCSRDGIIGDMRKHEFYEAPAVKRRKKREAARKRNKN